MEKIQKTKKENLVLVHSFPTNSVLLHGLVSLLDDYFNVYFVDLPGFHHECPPMGKISLNRFSNYLEKKVKELKLESYLIGGISFGFWVVNNSNLDKGCRGIVAIEPYTGWKSLRIGFFQRMFFVWLLSLISLLGIYDLLWRSKLLKRYYTRVTNYPLKRIKTIFAHFDPRTFFVTARIIMANRKKCHLGDVPYILIVNPNDKSIRGNNTIDFFKKNAKHLLIVTTRVGHYPRVATKKYFEGVLPKKVFERVYRFIDNLDDESDRFIAIY